jgi:hypothetical protein
LVDGNPELAARIRDKLRSGDISPWAPFLELPQPPRANLQNAAFAINFSRIPINNTSYDRSRACREAADHRAVRPKHRMSSISTWMIFRTIFCQQYYSGSRST